MNESLIVNWTNDDMWRAKDQYVRFRDGTKHLVKLGGWERTGYRSGWAVGEINGMDIFSARGLLNKNEAVLVDTD